MRSCRSCSPNRRNTCLSRRDCRRYCCLPARRCQSFSPTRSTKCSHECYNNITGDTCGPLTRYDLYTSPCLPRSRKYRPKMCSPCQPRSCYFSDRELTGCKSYSYLPCVSPLRCRYSPCNDPYPCSRDPCFPRTCEPCVSKKETCFPRKYNPCSPYSKRKWDSCLMCSPYYPLTSDPCSTARRWRTSKSCLPRASCDPHNPCNSKLCDFCNCVSPEPCRPRCALPCNDTTVPVSRIKLRGQTCDIFRKVCYPKALAKKSCTTECDPYKCSRILSNGTTCEITNSDSATCARHEGPSEKFFQTSNRLGNCLGRYEPHMCPWEADVAITGTVRGHCTSTAVEVARRMSGRFRAEGERYTTDSCESKVSCAPETQRMCLGKLDDGSVLNFSRNNDPSKKEINYNSRDSKSQDTLSSCTDYTKSNNKCRRKQGSDNQHGGCDSCCSGVCTVTSVRPSGLPTDEHWSRNENHKGQGSCCTRQLNHHSVRFGPDINTIDYQKTLEAPGQSHTIQNGNTPCSEIQSFLNSRKDYRRKNRASSSKVILQKSPPNQRVIHERHLPISPSSHSLRHHMEHCNSDSDSPLFTPPSHSHRAPIGDIDFSTSRSKKDLDHLILHSLREDDSYKRNGHIEYREISLENDNAAVNRRRSFQSDHGVDRLLDGEGHREHY